MAARRRSRQEWKQIVLEWQRSGLRKAQFTRRHGLNPKTFGFWCWTLKADLRRRNRGCSSCPYRRCRLRQARPLRRGPS